MLICACAEISIAEVKQTVEALRADDRSARITPSAVYRALDKRPTCGACVAGLNNHIRALAAGTTADPAEPAIPVFLAGLGGKTAPPVLTDAPILV